MDISIFVIYSSFSFDFPVEESSSKSSILFFSIFLYTTVLGGESSSSSHSTGAKVGSSTSSSDRVLEGIDSISGNNFRDLGRINLTSPFDTELSLIFANISAFFLTSSALSFLTFRAWRYDFILYRSPKSSSSS